MFSLLWVSLLLISSSYSSQLEEIADDELQNLVEEENHVIVMLSDDFCDMCEDYEGHLAMIREDLVDASGTYVVKVSGSALLEKFNIKEAPAILYYRSGIPMIYDGPSDEEEMLEFFFTNSESNLQHLHDTNFEHLTQASSGGTTGDWLIMFYSDNTASNATLVRLQTVAGHLKGRMNVAKVDRSGDGAKTARRFNVKVTPSFILLKPGRIYRYNLNNYDTKTLIKFTESLYKHSSTDNIPPEKSPFDDLTEACADYLKENPSVLAGGSAGFLIIILLVIYQLRKPTEEWEDDDDDKED